MNSNVNEKSAALTALSSINAVDGFDPAPLAVDYTDLNTGEVRKRLPVMAQIAWFRLKYPNGKISISVISENDCFVASAKVYQSYNDPIEGFLAEASASRGYLSDKPTVSPREWAQTAAVGIALRNAGFGLQFHAAGEPFDEPATNELDGFSSGAKAPDPPAHTKAEETQVQVQTQMPLSDTGAASKPQPAQPEESLLEQAYKQPCPITKYSGKTLQELLMIDPKALVWIAEKFTNNPAISAAAKLICEHALSVSTEAS